METENNSEPLEVESFAEAYRDPQIDELISALYATNMALRREAYRDPQIDELISALYATNMALRRIGNALYKPGEWGEVSELTALRHTIENALEPRPSWFARLRGWFRSRWWNSQMRKLDAAHKQKEAERREHMQHLAENAHLLNSGRFRSRYG